MPVFPALLPLPAERTGVAVRWARSKEDLLGAQRLRAVAFGFCDPKTPQGEILPEADSFDPHARHLIAVDTRSGRVVGTYRLLDWKGARKAGGFYTQNEFDLDPLVPFLRETLELGRSCVHPDFRNGGTIALLWSALARVLGTGPFRFLMGCASLDLTDPAMDPDRVWTHLRKTGWENTMENVSPHRPFPCIEKGGDLSGSPALPPLLKGYLRLGARCIGNPSHDPVFRTADFPLWLTLDSMKSTYARHFFRKTEGRAP